MKIKWILLFLSVILIFSCSDSALVFTGKLIDVEIITSGGLGGIIHYGLTFESNRVYVVYRQPAEGFEIGKTYSILHDKTWGSFRVKEKK